MSAENSISEYFLGRIPPDPPRAFGTVMLPREQKT